MQVFRHDRNLFLVRLH